MAKMGRTRKVDVIQEEILLPEGVTVITRTIEMELMIGGKNRWLPVAQKLERLVGMETIKLDLGDLKDMAGVNVKAKINAIRTGVRNAWVALGKKPEKLRSGVLNNALLFWVNS